MSPFRDDNNLDVMRQEKETLRKEVSLLKRENKYLEKQGSKSMGITVAKYAAGASVSIAGIVAAVVTGDYNYLFIVVLAFWLLE